MPRSSLYSGLWPSVMSPSSSSSSPSSSVLELSGEAVASWRTIAGNTALENRFDRLAEEVVLDEKVEAEDAEVARVAAEGGGALGPSSEAEGREDNSADDQDPRSSRSSAPGRRDNRGARRGGRCLSIEARVCVVSSSSSSSWRELSVFSSTGGGCFLLMMSFAGNSGLVPDPDPEALCFSLGLSLSRSALVSPGNSSTSSSSPPSLPFPYAGGALPIPSVALTTLNGVRRCGVCGRESERAAGIRGEEWEVVVCDCVECREGEYVARVPFAVPYETLTPT